MIKVIYHRNSNVIEVPELTRKSDGAHVTNASIQLTLTAPDGIAITGQAWPLAMHYIPGTNSTYRTTLEHTLTLPKRVVCHVIADAGPGVHGEWKTIFNVIERR